MPWCLLSVAAACLVALAGTVSACHGPGAWSRGQCLLITALGHAVGPDEFGCETAEWANASQLADVA